MTFKKKRILSNEDVVIDWDRFEDARMFFATRKNTVAFLCCVCFLCALSLNFYFLIYFVSVLYCIADHIHTTELDPLNNEEFYQILPRQKSIPSSRLDIESVKLKLEYLNRNDIEPSDSLFIPFEPMTSNEARQLFNSPPPPPPPAPNTITSHKISKQ